MITDEIYIDSLLLRLPMRYVTVENPCLTDTHRDYQVNENTGEMTPKKYKYKQAEFQPLVVEKKGYKYEFRVKTWTNPRTGISKQFLYMLVNAKMLESRYFEGIREDNIERIYNGLVSCNVANFNLQDFLENGQCTNVEFCKNFYSENLEYQLNHLKKRIKKSPMQNPNAKLTTKYGELSLRFNKKESSTPAKPHILIYDKEKELINNSTHFLTTYIKDADITNLARVEFRIKDAKHAKQLGIEDNDLITFLQLSQDRKQELLKTFTGRYLEAEKVEKQGKLTPTKQIYVNCIREMKKQGLEFGIIADIMTADLPKNRKHEKQKELRELYFAHIFKPVEIKGNEHQIYEVINAPQITF